MREPDPKSFVAPKPEWLAMYGFARTLTELAGEEPKGRLPFGKLWSAYRDEPPRGNWWMNEMSDPLRLLAEACHGLNLPYLNALLVSERDGKHSDGAVANMWEFAQQHGFAVGDDPRAFVEEQARQSAMISRYDLDVAFGQKFL